MATREGTRASMEFVCIYLVPDVCKSPSIPVPYKIFSKFDCAVNFSTNVHFRKQNAFHHKSRLSTVLCDEQGVGGGLLSGVNKGFCRPINGTSSTTVRVNGSFVDYHEGTYMFMNCAGPEGMFNTIGRVYFLGNMLPGPVSPSGKIPKGGMCGNSGILSQIDSSLGGVDDLVKNAKMLYSLATTDWSDPSAVLGAIGGIAGIAGLQDVAKYAGQAKELYDTGKKLLNTDFSDPLQALGAVAGLGNIPGMSDISKIAGLASTIGNTIKTDWSNPQAALAAATNIMKSTGLNQMAAQMLSNAILDSNIPVSQSGTTPPFFPKPGAGAGNSGSSGSTSSTAAKPPIPPSADGKERKYITPEVENYLKNSNAAAYERYKLLVDSGDPRAANAFVEIGPPSDGSKGSDTSPNDRTAIYIPGEGFSTTKEERDSLPNVSQYIPPKIRELFVADKQDATQGNFFGIKEKEGNVYLFGGLIDLGSPELPGAGNTQAWWVPDRILNMDMSPYYDYHDKGYYGSNVGLADLGKILNHELGAFKAGATLNPLQLPLQAIYSAATTAVGLGTAVTNEASKIGSGDFSSLKDFFGSVFGGGAVNPMDSQIMNIMPGGCMGPSAPTLPGQSAPGTGSGAPGSGAPPKPGTAGAPEGNASGAGKDGMLVTTAPGNPAAIAAALEAQFRKDNQAALEKAQAEEKAAQEKAEQEKAAKEKASGKSDEQASTRTLSDNTTGPKCDNPQTRPLTEEESKRVDAQIDEIENSKFGKTEEGQKVAAKLKDMKQNGKIVYAPQCTSGAASFDPETGLIRLEDGGLKGSDAKLGGQLVHEGTHAVDSDQFPNQSKNSIPDEARAYENGAIYESEKGGTQHHTDDLLKSRSREEFERRLKNDEDYKNNSDQRYPDVPPPKPFDENNILYRSPGGEGLYDLDRKIYDRNKAAFDQREAEKQFENDRNKDFENVKKTIQENRENSRKVKPKPAGDLSQI